MPKIDVGVGNEFPTTDAGRTMIHHHYYHRPYRPFRLLRVLLTLALIMTVVRLFRYAPWTGFWDMPEHATWQQAFGPIGALLGVALVLGVVLHFLRGRTERDRS